MDPRKRINLLSSLQCAEHLRNPPCPGQDCAALARGLHEIRSRVVAEPRAVSGEIIEPLLQECRLLLEAWGCTDEAAPARTSQPVPWLVWLPDELLRVVLSHCNAHALESVERITKLFWQRKVGRWSILDCSKRAFGPELTMLAYGEGFRGPGTPLMEMEAGRRGAHILWECIDSIDLPQLLESAIDNPGVLLQEVEDDFGRPGGMSFSNGSFKIIASDYDPGVLSLVSLVIELAKLVDSIRGQACALFRSLLMGDTPFLGWSSHYAGMVGISCMLRLALEEAFPDKELPDKELVVSLVSALHEVLTCPSLVWEASGAADATEGLLVEWVVSYTKASTQLVRLLSAPVLAQFARWHKPAMFSLCQFVLGALASVAYKMPHGEIDAMLSSMLHPDFLAMLTEMNEIGEDASGTDPGNRRDDSAVTYACSLMAALARKCEAPPKRRRRRKVLAPPPDAPSVHTIYSASAFCTDIGGFIHWRFYQSTIAVQALPFLTAVVQSGTSGAPGAAIVLGSLHTQIEAMCQCGAIVALVMALGQPRAYIKALRTLDDLSRHPGAQEEPAHDLLRESIRSAGAYERLQRIKHVYPWNHVPGFAPHACTGEGCHTCDYCYSHQPRTLKEPLERLEAFITAG